jgi:hypothetical protein
MCAWHVHFRQVGPLLPLHVPGYHRSAASLPGPTPQRRSRSAKGDHHLKVIIYRLVDQLWQGPAPCSLTTEPIVPSDHTEPVLRAAPRSRPAKPEPRYQHQRTGRYTDLYVRGRTGGVPAENQERCRTYCPTATLSRYSSSRPSPGRSQAAATGPWPARAESVCTPSPICRTPAVRLARGPGYG